MSIKTTNRFQSILNKNQFYLQDMQKKSLNWYWKQVDELKSQRITPNSFIADNMNKAKSRITVGSMYFFGYDPKTKNDLPYYDNFPLIFPFAPAKGGFMGINMHYLPYKLRIILLEELMNYKSNERLDEKTKIEMSWSMLKSLSSNKLVQPCVKRYLYSHVKTKLIKIESFHYATALMLPVARFKKQNEFYVWNDSIYGK